MLQAPEEFTSFEAFELHEKESEKKTLSYYYIPGNLTRDYEFVKITKRENVYVTTEYKVSSNKAVSTEKLSTYDSERLSTLLCQYYLYEDGTKALSSFTGNGFEAVEYGDKIYYRWDEHMENNPDKQIIGYEVVFLKDEKLIYMHLPAIDSFENMIKFADVVKVNID